MTDKDDTSHLLDGSGDRRGRTGATPDSPSSYGTPGVQERQQSTAMRLMQLAFVVVVVFMVVVTVILSIVRAAQAEGLYAMLGLSLIGFVVLEIFMILFIKHGDLPPEKNWFLFVVGGCIILEAIFTDVLLYQ